MKILNWLRNGVIAAAVLGALYAMVPAGIVLAQSAACYMSQGGASWNAGSGCTFSVKSGGIINIESGGALQVAGTDATSVVSGVAAGYKVARGETALGGSSPTNITTGLTTIVACTTTVKKTTSPTSEQTITYTTSSGTLSLYVWQPSGAAVTTLVASASVATVGWICVGT